MKDTCLSPFYKYLLKQWFVNNNTLSDEQQFKEVTQDNTSELSRILNQRKRSIWEKTKLLQDLSEEEYLEKITEYLAQDISCGLCMECQQCEYQYWNELKKITSNIAEEGGMRERSLYLLPDYIRQLLEQSERPVEIYSNYRKREQKQFQEYNYLLMLKGLSSSTPLLLNYADNTNMYSGGGFYLRWNGKGIVIDPGYQFVKNMQEYGITVMDIDAVIITHEHLDHAYDMRLLDDLHYNLASYRNNMRKQWQKDEFEYHIEKDKHKIVWFLDEISYNQALLFQNSGSGFQKDYNTLICINPKKMNSIPIIDGISLHVFRTAHEERKEAAGENGKEKIGKGKVSNEEKPTKKDEKKKEFLKHTFGFVLECVKEKGDMWIGYTSDTSLKDGVYTNMYSALKKCHIIIANISGIYEDEVLLKPNKDKSRHLGYFGCYRILHDIAADKDAESPIRYMLLSEFSNQISDIRFGVSKYMQEEIKKTVKRYQRQRVPVILPAEIGLKIELDDLKVKCSICHRYAEEVKVLKACGENKKMQYVCKECIYSSE